MKSDDEALLEGIRRGDEDAFVTLYRRLHRRIYRFAFHMSGNASVAEEVTQEVFLALLRREGHYDRGRGSVAGFLFGIARNHVLRCLERNRSYVPIDTETEVVALVAAGDPWDELARNEVIESVRRAVLALPPAYREAVVLCDLHEMSYSEAAMVLGCAVGTVRSRLSRGRALLAQKLGLRMGTKPVGCAL